MLKMPDFDEHLRYRYYVASSRAERRDNRFRRWFAFENWWNRAHRPLVCFCDPLLSLVLFHITVYPIATRLPRGCLSAMG